MYIFRQIFIALYVVRGAQDTETHLSGRIWGGTWEMPGFTKIKVTSWLWSTQIFPFLGWINLLRPFPRALCALQPGGLEQNTQPGGPWNQTSARARGRKTNPNAGHETSHEAVSAACSCLYIQSPSRPLANSLPGKHQVSTMHSQITPDLSPKRWAGGGETPLPAEFVQEPLGAGQWAPSASKLPKNDEKKDDEMIKRWPGAAPDDIVQDFCTPSVLLWLCHVPNHASIPLTCCNIFFSLYILCI